MVATAIQEKIAYHTNGHTPYVSWAEFQKKFLSREDSFKYEWVDGTVEKTPRIMDQSQYYLLDNIEAVFNQLKNEQKASGKFYTEIDTFFLDKVHRRPDCAYFTEDQRKFMARRINQVPKFILEIISTKDQINLVHKKMQNYRDASVDIVWHIFPLLNEIHVYKGYNMTVCRGEMMCSAEPVIPYFNISVNDVFKKP
jgi:Uma2 family endonuclease